MSSFHFKQFSVKNEGEVFKVGTDGVLLAAWAAIPNSGKCLDIGTGTGMIPLILAQRSKGLLKTTAIDIQEASVAIAKENFDNSPWKDSLKAIHQDARTLQMNEQFDLIISNPPYFHNSTLAATSVKQKAKHTNSLSHHYLLGTVSKHLKPGGSFCVILPYVEGQLLLEQAEDDGLYPKKVTTVYSKPDKAAERLLMHFTDRSGEVVEDDFIIHGESIRGYSQQYLDLTAAFYPFIP